jgi:AcrR family transcriptional regulator
MSVKNKQRYRNEMAGPAEILLFSQGYDSVTMGYLVRESGFNTPTIRLFFNDRESFYLSALLSSMRTLNAMYADHTESEAVGLEKISALGQTINEFSRCCPDYYRSVYAREPCDMYNEQMAAVITCIEDEAVRGELGQTELILYLVILSIGIIQVDPAWNIAMESAGIDCGRFAADFPGFIDNVMNARCRQS